MKDKKCCQKSRKEGYEEGRKESKKFDLAVEYGYLVYKARVNGIEILSYDQARLAVLGEVAEVLRGMKIKTKVKYSDLRMAEIEERNQALSEAIAKIESLKEKK